MTNKKLKRLLDSFVDFKRHSFGIDVGPKTYNRLESMITDFLQTPELCVKQLEKIFLDETLFDDLVDCIFCKDECCVDTLNDLREFITSKSDVIKNTLTCMVDMQDDVTNEYVVPEYLVIDQMECCISH